MRVFISGYYGFGNLGDEMLLDALKKLLLLVGVGREDLIVLSASPQKTYEEHGLPSMRRGDLLAIFKTIRKNDLLISGPGGLFQDITGPFTPAFYATHLFLAWIKGAKIWVYGQSLGPIKRKINMALLKLALERASLITLRDSGMKSIVPKEKLCFTPDPAFSLEFSHAHQERKGICFVFRQWKWNLEEIIQEALKLGHPLTLVSFQPSVEREVGLRLSRRYNLPFVMLDNWLEACELISSFEVVIGMRLHSLVISAITSTPFIGIGYDPKVKNLCIPLGMPCIDLKGVDFLYRYTNDLMVKWNEISNELREKVELLREKVRVVFKECWNLLLEGGSTRE
ncbi:MAG: polysaccharide pyruvyl transferase family protein [Synergistetes bacterium]|nr:polysaccharide pyruvyl transferase family protein [Synergistota bacterium]